jgi:hypothetical protein
MKCAGPAIRIAQRVNFRGASAVRAADRLFVLPPFPPLAERCALIEVESIDKITLCLPQLAKASKIAPQRPRLDQRASTTKVNAQNDRGGHSACLNSQNAVGGVTVRTQSLTLEKMEARVARFNKLQTYQRQNFEAHGIPPVLELRPQAVRVQLLD